MTSRTDYKIEERRREEERLAWLRDRGYFQGPYLEFIGCSRCGAWIAGQGAIDVHNGVCPGRQP